MALNTAYSGIVARFSAIPHHSGRMTANRQTANRPQSRLIFANGRDRLGQRCPVFDLFEANTQPSVWPLWRAFSAFFRRSLKGTQPSVSSAPTRGLKMMSLSKSMLPAPSYQIISHITWHKTSGRSVATTPASHSLKRVFQRDASSVGMEVTRQGYQWQPLSFFLVVIVEGIVSLEGQILADIDGDTDIRLVPV